MVRIKCATPQQAEEARAKLIEYIRSLLFPIRFLAAEVHLDGSTGCAHVHVYVDGDSAWVVPPHVDGVEVMVDVYAPGF